MLKVLFLDWYKTLSDSVFWEHVLIPSHPDYDDFQKIQTAVFRNPLNLISPWMRGRYTLEQIVQIASSVAGIKADRILGELRFSCEHMRFVSDEIIPLVEAFRSRGVKVVITTDNMDTFDRWTVPALKLDRNFDAVFNSHRLKFLKQDIGPDNTSPFFDPIFRTLGISPAESILVDDSRNLDYLKNNVGMEVRTIPSSASLIPELTRIYGLL